MASIISAYIEITGLCNEKCPYCYNDINVSVGDSIPFPHLISVLSELKSQHNLNNVVFSGGEPFLYPHVQQLLAYCKENHILVAIISNGKCFEPDNFDLLLRFAPNLQLSFDGFDSSSHDPTRGGGNFKLITDGIVTLRNRGYAGQITARVNFHKNNFYQFDKLLTLFERLSPHINTISLSVLHKTHHYLGTFADFISFDEICANQNFFNSIDCWNSSHSVKIVQDFNTPDIGCPYVANDADIKCGIRIAPDGKVFPCQLFMDDLFCLGDTNCESIHSILNGDKLISFSAQVRNRTQQILNCQKCGFKLICAGGCPAMAYVENHDINSVTSICKLRKSQLSALVCSVADQFRTNSL